MDYKYLGHFYQKYMTQLEITNGQRTKCGKQLYDQIEKHGTDIQNLRAIFATSLSMPPYLNISDDVISARLSDIMDMDDNFVNMMELMKKAYTMDKLRITRNIIYFNSFTQR
jgi:hypothetical protein